MVISVLKLKGQLITCKIIYLLNCMSPNTLFSGRIPPFVRYFKHFNNFKNGSDHIIVKYSLYTVKGRNLRWFFFSLIDDDREKNHLYGILAETIVSQENH
jgi:hypothetical protein